MLATGSAQNSGWPDPQSSGPRPDTACWRLLSGPGGPGAEPLAQHVIRLGRRPIGGTWLMDVLDASNLRGRGGAAFPTGRKWRSVAAAANRDAVVVVNLAEGEPASFKDRTLGALRPHLILDGAALAAETIAHVALIARYGAAWFRQVGTPDSPGTALVTVLGAVRRPGVIEVDRGATVGAVIEAAGGLTRAPQAVLLGGYFGTWVAAFEAWNLRLDDKELAN